MIFSFVWLSISPYLLLLFYKSFFLFVSSLYLFSLNNLLLGFTRSQIPLRFMHLLARWSCIIFISGLYLPFRNALTNNHMTCHLVILSDHGVGYVQIPQEKTIGRASVVKSDGSSLYLTRYTA